EMIDEFKLNRNAFGAEFGDDAAAVVNVSTKSGSNEFHGTAYEFFRNDKLKARNFFDITNPPLHYNDFGASLAGPVIRNKLFFFSSGEMFRERRSSTLRGLFPSKGQLNGNLADNSASTAVFPTSSAFCVASPRSAQCGDVLDPDTKQP